MKQLLHLTILSFFTLFSLNCLSDIRPASLKSNPLTKINEQKGRKLLKQLEKTYGGRKNYEAKIAGEAKLSDYWPGFMSRTMVMPWYKNKQSVKYSWLLSKDISRLEFIEEPHKGEIWGIQNWATYKIEVQQKIKFEQDKEIKFWLPTLEYFIEAPFRISDANIIQYVGEKEANSQSYDLIFLSWKKAEPQYDIDQYVVWINKKTGLMDYMQYTVRDMMRFIKGTMFYSNFKKLDGITIPFLLSVVDDVENHTIVHQIKIESLKFTPEKPQQFFKPNNSIRYPK